MEILFFFYVFSAFPFQILACQDSVGYVPEIHNRSRLFKATTEEGYLNDRNLTTGWYSAFQDGKQYLMTDANTIPRLSSCGTLHPLYLQDEHPDLKSMNETSVEATVCMRTDSADCEFTLTIEIRKCKQEVQYYLVSTGSLISSYCFAVAAAPKIVSVGKVTVKPKLEHTQNKWRTPEISLLCEISSVSGDVSNLYIHTLWFIDAELKVSSMNVGETTPLNETHLVSGLGKNISCGVRISMTPDGTLTTISMSDLFYAGIKVENTDVIIVKGEKDTKKHLTRTIPFGCRASENKNPCTFAVEVFKTKKCSNHIAAKQILPLPTHHTSQHMCGVVFEGTRPGEDASLATNETDLLINTIDMTLDDPKSYTLQLKLTSEERSIWDGYMLEPVRVTVIDDRRYRNKICIAMVNLHMTTFTGYSYELQSLGDFIMYRNVMYETEVQIRTKRCNDGVAKCVCAVAIRAGGDVFRMDYCKNLSDWSTSMTSCMDNGIIIFEEDNTFLTPIGTKIKVDVDKYTGYMNIKIRLAPKDVNNTDGLCGYFSSGPEIVDRKGRPINDHRINNHHQNVHDNFSEVWRVNSNENNYLKDECFVGATQWRNANLSVYCVCGNSSNSDLNEETNTAKAYCSPSQFVSRHAKPSLKTEKLCKTWKSRCNSNKSRKKLETTITKRHFDYNNLKKDNKRSLHKRQAQIFSKLDAIKLCTESIANHPAFTYVKEAAEGFNAPQAIINCAVDTYEGQTDSWINSYISVVTDVVNMNMEIDPKYTETHAIDVLKFRRLTCPLNCSGNGMCTDEGICSCNKGFSGTDCSIKLSVTLTIYGLNGEDFVDRHDFDGGTFAIESFDLVKGFFCKVERRKILIDGTKMNTTTTIIEGEYFNEFTGTCTFPPQRDDNAVLASEYDVSISNDGIAYSARFNYFVFDPKCHSFGIRTDGSATVYIKDNTCYFGGKCYISFESENGDTCYKCIPNVSQLTRTFDCTKPDNNHGLPVYAVVLVSFASVLIIVVPVILFFKCKKQQKLQRVDSPGRNRTVPIVSYIRTESTMDGMDGSKISIRDLDLYFRKL